MKAIVVYESLWGGESSSAIARGYGGGRGSRGSGGGAGKLLSQRPRYGGGGAGNWLR